MGTVFLQEVSHLHKAVELLKKYDKKDWQEVIPDGKFPPLLRLGPNIEYIRNVLKNTSDNTSNKESYSKVSDLPESSDFFKFQEKINGNVSNVPSHKFIEHYIKQKGEDYRFQTDAHPLDELQDKSKDNYQLGRK